MFKAVIFDRDGVLLDSTYTNITAAERAFAELGIQILEDEKKWVIGRHPDDYMVLFSEKYTFNHEQFKELQRKYYYELLKSTAVFEKTIQLLKDIHATGTPVALCTSSSREGSHQVLGNLGIKGLFTEIVTKDDYTKRKPDPEPYLVTAQKLGITPDECLVFEDSEVGLRSALSAGMQCIVIFNEYTKDHDFTGALQVIGSADEVDFDEIITKDRE